MKQQKGMTLIEVLISFVLLSIIIVPFLSLLSYATGARLTTHNMLYANYAAANQMEKLAAMNCGEICLSNGEFIEGNMLIRFSSVPWTISQEPCFYFIFQDGRQSGYECIIVSPEGGKGILLDKLPDFIQLDTTIDEDNYHIQLNSLSLAGEIPEGRRPIIIVNGAFKPVDVTINLSFSGDADIILYSGGADINVDYDGVIVVNPNIYYRDYTLFKSVVEVYDIRNPVKLLSKFESILRIPN